MEERKLNLNAPLLSVRRISATAGASSTVQKVKRNVVSLQNSRRTRASSSCEPEVCSDQVTDPVAVPFVWEQIPGKCKESVSSELQASMEGPTMMPSLPPGRVMDIVKYPSEKEAIGQSVCIQNDHEMKQDDSNGGDETNGLESDNEDEVFSDALETLSPTKSISLNYTVSMVSESDHSVVKPPGTLSSDVQARDFMMSRFLPAAKAMTLEPPQYSSRKPPIIAEQPREVNRMVIQEVREPPQNQCQAIIVPHYELKAEEETEEEDSEIDFARANISRKACGLLPRLCFKNSLSLLNPFPGLKVRAYSSKSSIGKSRKPSKVTSKQFSSQQNTKLPEIRVKPFHATNRLTKSGELPKTSTAQSPYLSEIKNKPFYTANWLTKSGEFQITNRVHSPKLPEIRGKPLYSETRPTKSGELQIMSRAQSPKLAEMRPRPLYSENRLTRSGELQEMRHRPLCSENRLTRSGELQVMSRPQSPKLAEMRNSPLCGESRVMKPGDHEIANSSSPSRLSVSGRISPYRRERPQSPFKGGGLLGFPKEGENPRTTMLHKYDWTSIRSHSHELVSNRSGKQGSGSALGSLAVERTLHVDNGNRVEASSSVLYATMKDEIVPELRASGRIVPYQSYAEAKTRDMDSVGKADDKREAKEGDYPEPAPLSPPPLPKVPSESWLWRTLSTVTLRSSEAQDSTKKQDSITPAATAKWETIVKTSYQHHDHVRYSEELTSLVSKHQKK